MSEGGLAVSLVGALLLEVLRLDRLTRSTLGSSPAANAATEGVLQPPQLGGIRWNWRREDGGKDRQDV